MSCRYWGDGDHEFRLETETLEDEEAVLRLGPHWDFICMRVSITNSYAILNSDQMRDLAKYLNNWADKFDAKIQELTK